MIDDTKPPTANRAHPYHSYECGDGMTILGQNIFYPKNIYSLAALLIVVVAIAGTSIYLIHSMSKPDFLKGLHNMFSTVSIEQGALNRESVVRLGFWTPSDKTKDTFLTEAGSPDLSTFAPDDQWELEVTNDKLKEFAKILGDSGKLKGYRRYAVEGQGRTRFKIGWWWVVTMDASYDPKDLAQKYADFFKTKKPLYLEIFRSAEQ